MPLPSSSLPGHQQLHERASAALDTCQEAEDVDFKESAEFETIKIHVIHTVLAMGNLRDGGLIVVGVSQRDDRWETSGMTEPHLATYEPDTVVDAINAYVSPFIDLDVVSLSREEKTFVLIGVHEFRDTPVLCKKNGPNGTPLQKGRLFIRPPGLARSTVIDDARQMHDLLELAAEKRARRMIEASTRIGMVIPGAISDSERYSNELGGL